MRLSELNIDDTLISRYAQDTLRIIHDENGNLPGRPAMTEADIIEVLKSVL
jgi:alcohol dehydrogenase